jgi:hypothetical protein
MMMMRRRRRKRRKRRRKGRRRRRRRRKWIRRRMTMILINEDYRTEPPRTSSGFFLAIYPISLQIPAPAPRTTRDSALYKSNWTGLDWI